MKKLVLVSHCVMNPFCELPQAPDQLRKPIFEKFMNKEWGIVQLPCPELCYQALERTSIYPGDDTAKPYRDYCRELLVPLLKNLDEYTKYDIRVAGVIGIDTSPSCSVVDDEAIMMELLLEEMKKMGYEDVPRTDMPVNEEGDSEAFLKELDDWVRG